MSSRRVRRFAIAAAAAAAAAGELETTRALVACQRAMPPSENAACVRWHPA